MADQDNRPICFTKLLTRLCRVDSSTITLWTGPFPVEGWSGNLYYYHVLWKRFISNESVDPDQTPHSAASDLVLHCLPMSLYAASNLGLHCLPMSLLWNSRHKWGNRN